MVYMYMKDPVEEFDWMKLTPAVAICIIIAVVGVLLPGVVPAFLLNLAQQAVLL